MPGMYGAISLNELIALLRGIPADAVVKRMSPEIISWRGDYALNCIEPDGGEIAAKDLADALSGEIGKTMTGWKGGEFTVEGGNEVFLAFDGSTGEAIVGLTVVPDGTYVPAVAPTTW